MQASLRSLHKLGCDRVSKDETICGLMVRDARGRAPHHEGLISSACEKFYRSKKPGPDADRPTLPGGRGIAGARGGGAARGALPNPKKSLTEGVPD